jgi:hypothetical protein
MVGVIHSLLSSSVAYKIGVGGSYAENDLLFDLPIDSPYSNYYSNLN